MKISKILGGLALWRVGRALEKSDEQRGEGDGQGGTGGAPRHTLAPGEPMPLAVAGYGLRPSPNSSPPVPPSYTGKPQEKPGRLKLAWTLLRDSVKGWSDDKAPRLGAALSYYTVFSLAPVLLIVISVAGLVLGGDAAQGRLLDQMRGLLGNDAAKLVQEMLASTAKRKSGIIGTVVGVATLIAGATAVMLELEAALDEVWKVERKGGGGIKAAIFDRILSLGLVLTLGFLLVVSLAASAALAAVGSLLDRWFPGASIVAPILQNALSIAIIGVFFAVLYKFLPNAKIQWRDVWVGAFATSFLFHVGKIGIGFYLGRASVGSTFGAAGSLAVLLVWVYYTAQILLLGAEFTRVWANRVGGSVVSASGGTVASTLPETRLSGHLQPRPQNG